MRWVLSLSLKNGSGSHDLAVHLARDDETAAKVSGPIRTAAALILCGPLLWALAQSALTATHALSPALAAGPAPLILRTWASVGPVGALVLNLWWSAHFGTGREGARGSWREICFSLDPVSVSLVVLAGSLVVAFYGHLLADSWACTHGVRSAC